MKLIETEALFKNRKAELSAREAGVDPELLAQKRIKDALRKDPDIASLMKEIEQAPAQGRHGRPSNAEPSDPSLVHSSRQLEAMKQDLRDLIARKQEELASLGADGDDTLLHELNGQIEFAEGPQEQLRETRGPAPGDQPEGRVGCCEDGPGARRPGQPQGDASVRR